MTPKEKAIELIERHRTVFQGDFTDYYHKQSSLISIDEIINLNKRVWVGSKANGSFSDSINIDYWREVMTEIKKL